MKDLNHLAPNSHMENQSQGHHFDESSLHFQQLMWFLLDLVNSYYNVVLKELSHSLNSSSPPIGKTA